MAPRISKAGFRHEGFVIIDEEFLPCSVANMSATGATLHLPPSNRAELPETFLLQVARKIERTCTVAWREDDEVGVLFKAA